MEHLKRSAVRTSLFHPRRFSRGLFFCPRGSSHPLIPPSRRGTEIPIFRLRISSMKNTDIIRAIAALALLPGSSQAFEFDPFDTPSAEETASLDALWKAFTLYKSDDNPILQEFKLRGRYH